MVFNFGVVAVSFLLLLYWFRYTCVLILRNKPVGDYSKQVATANRLTVFEVQSQLAGDIPPGALHNLDELQRMLDRDYRLLMYLRAHASKFRTTGYEIEQSMLRLNYHTVKLAYAVTRHFSMTRASVRLSEMAAIIAHFANIMGERAAVASAQ